MNKAKILKSAEKYVLQGRLSAAISEYQKIVESDPNDLPILNTMGDLYVRLGNTSRGLDYFNQLATAYHDSGYKVKAIAIYKKITKLSPDSEEARRRLAELYASQGLASESRAQYLQLAEACARSNRLDQASEALQKLLSTDPENAEALARLVDVEMKRRNVGRAVELLLSSAERSRKKGNLAAAKDAMQRVQAISPDSAPAKMVLAKIYFSEGQPENAVALLNDLDPSGASPDIQLGLWECYFGAGRLDDAGRVAQRLLGHDPNQFSLLFSLSERYLADGDFDHAVTALDPLMEASSFELFGSRLSGAFQKILSEDPDHLPAIERSVKVSRRLGQTHLISLALEHLASYHIKKENFDAALKVYRELLEIDPSNTIVRQGMERLQAQMRGTPGREQDEEEEGISGSPFERSSERAPAASENLKTIQEFNLRDASTASTIEPRVKAAFEEENVDDELLNSLVLEAELLAGYGLLKRAAQTFEELVQISPSHSVALRRLVELYTALDQLADAARCCAKLSKASFKAGQVEEARQWTERATQLDQEVQSRPISTEPEPAAAPESGLETPEREQKGKPSGRSFDLSEELEEMGHVSAAPAEAVRAERASQKEDQVLTEALEEIDFYMHQGFWAEALALTEKTLETFPHFQPLDERLARCREMAPAPQVSQGQPSFQETSLTSKLEVSVETSPESSTLGLGDVLSEFDGVEGATTGSADFSTHYNLGIAFREMGLLEEAIAEAQKALTTLEPEQNRSDYVSACSLLGLCLVESKNFPEAVEWLERALATLGNDGHDDEALSLKFDLADACQLAGDFERAFNIFDEVHRGKPSFREVGKRLEALRQMKASGKA